MTARRESHNVAVLLIVLAAITLCFSVTLFLGNLADAEGFAYPKCMETDVCAAGGGTNYPSYNEFFRPTMVCLGVSVLALVVILLAARRIRGRAAGRVRASCQAARETTGGAADPQPEAPPCNWMIRSRGRLRLTRPISGVGDHPGHDADGDLPDDLQPGGHEWSEHERGLGRLMRRSSHGNQRSRRRPHCRSNSTCAAARGSSAKDGSMLMPH
jgi:hypothetical protein